jgi:HAD superfamily hydrolase (TIGR01549 family)
VGHLPRHAKQRLASYFAGLRPRYRTGIISNSFAGAREREQEQYGFRDLTDVIIYSHEAGMSKPDPRIYRPAAERLGVRPEEMVYLDDVPEFVNGARQEGLQAVLFTGTSRRSPASGRCWGHDAG